MDHDLITINIGRAKELMEKVYYLEERKGRRRELLYYHFNKIPVYNINQHKCLIGR
jgi:hypothetical protein